MRVCRKRNGSAGKRRKERAQGQDEPGREGASEGKREDRGKKRSPVEIGDRRG